MKKSDQRVGSWCFFDTLGIQSVTAEISDQSSDVSTSSCTAVGPSNATYPLYLNFVNGAAIFGEGLSFVETISLSNALNWY